MKMTKNKALTPERIMQLSWGYAPPLILEAAVKHRVFDLLNESPKTAQQLAAKSGASVRGLTAICNALVGLQFLARAGDRYKLTPESAAFLVSGKNSYYGGFLKHISRQLIPQWLDLTQIVKTGKPAKRVNSQKEGVKFFADFVESILPLSYAA
ncbi:MAG: methyltransferase family protein, partial [Limisphaerales bacterium]